MTGSDACCARNECSENESDVHQFHLICTSYECVWNAGMFMWMYVDTFTYLESAISMDGSVQKDIKSRLGVSIIFGVR